MHCLERQACQQMTPCPCSRPAPQALNQLTQKTISATAASLLKDMGDVSSASGSLQDALKGLQGTAGEQAKASMDKISAASAALNDVAGKLTGERLGTGLAWLGRWCVCKLAVCLSWV